MAREGGGWIDYVIASGDPVDRALLVEFHARAWAHGQLMRHITADPSNINEETFAKLEEDQELENALQDRIYTRGKALRDAGRPPCDEAAFKAWRATWVPLASHIASDDDPLPET